jgi:hypothetical protein
MRVAAHPPQPVGSIANGGANGLAESPLEVAVMGAIGAVEEAVGALLNQLDLVVEYLLALLGSQMAH